MQRTLAELKQECTDRGIPVESRKYGKKELISMLQEYSFRQLGEENISWGLRKRLEMESPMLCFSFKHLKPEQKETCMNSLDWLAEVKCDGVRMVATYHPLEGFKFFSRNLSVTDFLPVEYTDKILVWPTKQGVLPQLGYEFATFFSKSFVLDCELTCSNPNIDTTQVRGKYGTETETVLNAVTSILSIKAADSIDIQKHQDCPLEFQVFDVYEFDNRPIWKQRLSERLIARCRLVSRILGHGWQVQEVKGTTTNKREFYDQLLADGGEGIVLKNLDSPYIPTTSRRRDGFVKLKRSMQESVGSDIDAFIIGFVESNPKKGWAHLIGAIKMGVFIPHPSGESKIHHIASVASMPLAMREAMTIQDENGKPSLKYEYLQKVLVINGQDIAPKSLRFMHAIADWKRGFRDEKNYLDCEMSQEILDSMVL